MLFQNGAVGKRKDGRALEEAAATIGETDDAGWRAVGHPGPIRLAGRERRRWPPDLRASRWRASRGERAALRGGWQFVATDNTR
jgi:hypothetical protein